MTSKHIEAMYRREDNDDLSIKSEPTNLQEESYIETRKNVAVINVGDKKVAVPTVAHIQEMVKNIDALTRHLKQLENENRRLRAFMNKQASEINRLINAVDNKMDKF